MSPRPAAEDEIRRILAMIPWIIANPGRPRSEIAARFGLTDREAEKALSRINIVGTPPFSPGDYVEALDDGEDGVEITLGDAFRRPLRFHPSEALHVLAAGRALLAVPGAQPDGPLASALAKLEHSLGAPAPDVTIDDEVALTDVQLAVRDGERIEIEYVAGDGEATTRTVDPARVFYRDGEWYLAAFCHRAGDDRMFRVDRIAAVRPTGERFDPVDVSALDTPFRPGPSTQRVTLRIPARAQWVVESVPTESVADGPDGTLDVVLAVADASWLERLLLRIGPDATVLGPDEWVGCTARAATRVLARYERG